MAKVIVALSMSLDGFIAGSNDRTGQRLGKWGITSRNTYRRARMRAGLLDEIQIHLIAVLLGSGVRLFDHLGTENIELETIRVVDSPGVTHLRYRVVK